MSMTLDEYLTWTDGFAVYPEIGTGSMAEKSYLGLGLCGEVGELCKIVRDGTYVAEAVKAELGDVLWYWVRLCRVPRLEPSYIVRQTLPNATLAVGVEAPIHMARWAGTAADMACEELLHPHLVHALARTYSCWEQTCRWLCFEPADVMEHNVAKLESRRARNTLQGSGDNR